MRGKYIAILFTIGLAGCQPTAGSSEEAVGALKAADMGLQKALVDKNLGQIVSYYAPDAVLLPTAEPMVEGKAAIKEEWGHILAIPNFSNAAQLRGAQVSRSGDLGYTWGTYRSKMMGEDGNPVEEPGKWVTIWKRGDGGEWRVVMDTYNTDIPPPDHK